MTGWTKGEWRVNTIKGIRVQNEARCICLVGENDEEDEANARLIASAPAMYEALKEARDYLRFNKGNASPIFNKADEALAKAEGRKKSK